MPVGESIVDGDTGFVGVNSRLEPSQLPQGFVASAINKRFVNGVAKTRSGIKKRCLGQMCRLILIMIL